MLNRILVVPLLLLIQLGQAHATGNNWVDAVSLTIGKDENSNETDVYRLGVQNKWNRTLFNGGAWFVGGYWDLAFAYMESDIDETDLYDLSITPVLRLQRDASLSSGVTPFSEIGIGAHLISNTEIGKRDLSTSFQFASHIGLGLGLGPKGQYEVAYQFQHLSNFDIKRPNEGLDLHLIRFAYNFE